MEQSLALGECCGNLDDLALVDGIVEELRAKASVRELWDVFSESIAGLSQKTRVQRHTLCMELCKDTLDSEIVLRVHMHVSSSTRRGRK